MKKLGLIALSTMILSLSNMSFAAEKVAVIDVQAVVAKSAQVQALKKEQFTKTEELKKWLTNAKKDIEKQKTDEAKAKLTKKYEAEYVKKQEAMRKSYMEKLQTIDKSINATIAEQAKAKGFDMVITKGIVIYGGDDITEDVIKVVK